MVFGDNGVDIVFEMLADLITIYAQPNGWGRTGVSLSGRFLKLNSTARFPLRMMRSGEKFPPQEEQKDKSTILRRKGHPHPHPEYH